MSESAKLRPCERVVFVLDRPREAANVGAVVRLLGNFGLARLRLVEPAAFDEGTIRRMARRGEAVLATVERHASLGSALADCSLVLGTTRRERALDRPVVAPRLAASMLLAATGLATASGEADAAPAPSVAVLFGPEDFGLSNAALDYCHAIVTIPTVPNDASLNLAQAAAIVAYELHLAAIGVEVGYPADATSSRLRGEAIVDGFATGAELDALFDSCYHMLTALYQPNIEGRTRAALARIRAMIMRAEPRGDEARLLTTVFEHLARKLQGTSAR